jgi:hypothetical protein
MQIKYFVQEFANQCFGDVKWTMNMLVNNFNNIYTSKLLSSTGGCKLGITSMKREFNLDQATSRSPYMYAGISDLWKPKMVAADSY